MYDVLYSVHLQDNNVYKSLSLTIGIEMNVMNEESSLLWQQKLGHISIQRIKILVNEGAFNALNFTDFEICLDCLKGKQTNKSKKGVTRSKRLFEIIHTDICYPDMDGSDLKYFITFINDYSCYIHASFYGRRARSL